MTCALRALTLCDGSQLETPEGALSSCLCDAIERCSGRVSAELLEDLRVERQRLIERTLVSPPLRF